MHKAQAYVILANLQEKHVIEASVGTPTRFYPVQIGIMLDEVVRAKRSEADSINERRGQILAYWQSMQPAQTKYDQERFATLTSRRAVNSKILEMIRDSKHEIRLLLSVGEVIRANSLGVFETLQDKLIRTKDSQAMILAPIQPESIDIARKFSKLTRDRHLAIEWRHSEINSLLVPPLIVRDEEESCILPPESPGNNFPSDTLWTNARVMTRICSALFTELWHGKMSAQQRIQEMEAGETSGVSVLIDDPRLARKRFVNAIQNAKREVTYLLPYQRVLEDENLRPFWSVPGHGVKVRLMCPLGSKVKTQKYFPKTGKSRTRESIIWQSQL
ncbi:MAG TPA: hypothetical protein VLV31_00845 [Candidatus Acidoferrales bacterium]|nr:hypothetical protein [Candidatus Acidoferrales bacterium]